jgi:polyribonucleotide nucleotidyltransferase
MGLIAGDNGNHAILTDIEGIEDVYGDMDFKIAGTTEGITALQMDTKLKGINPEILKEALEQGREARLSILDVMQQTITSSRSEVSAYAPRVYKITVAPDKIGAIIGTGGKTIRAITDETKTTIDIENDGTVTVYSTDKEGALKAIKVIENLTKEAEIGDIYTGKVTRLLNFGAFVEILPGKDGLVHISELADHRVASVGDVVKMGDEITVKVIGIDDMGRVNLSLRAMLDKSSHTPDTKAKDTPSSGNPPRKHYDTRPSRGGEPHKHSFNKRKYM